MWSCAFALYGCSLGGFNIWVVCFDYACFWGLLVCDLVFGLIICCFVALYVGFVI